MTESPEKDAPRRRMKRAARRTDGPRLRRTERDFWVLEALAKMQFLTTRQIGHLLFNGSRSAANKRLRKLFDAGLIRVWLRSLNTDNVYALALPGRRLLEEESDA